MWTTSDGDRSATSLTIELPENVCMIQVDIGGHPPFPTGPKHVSGNFGNLLFLAVFSGPELPGPFLGPKRCFFGNVALAK